MKHNKNADISLFPLSFTECQREKNIERTFFVSAGAQEGEKWRVLGLHTIFTELQKKNLPVKFMFA